MQAHRLAVEGRHLAIDEGVRKLLHLGADLVQLEQDRTGIERVERQKIGHGQAGRADIVAAAMGHDAVTDFEQHVIGTVRRIRAGHMAEDVSCAGRVRDSGRSTGNASR